MVECELCKYERACPDGTHAPAFYGCGVERPQRKTLCQLPKGHEGSHQAVIYWE